MTIQAPLRDGAVQWIRAPEALADLAARLAVHPIVALDSESDSLHHFPEQVCLLQIATPAEDVFLVDPLLLRRLEALAPILADPRIIKVFHGAAYDLAALRRDFAFRVNGLFDTMVAAQFAGLRELGLSALLQQLLGVVAVPSRQKDDWAARPLTPEQERYAAEDVRSLIALRSVLLERLQALGRAAWAAEECRALEETPAAARVFDPDDAFAVKGARMLDPRGLAILRELFIVREAWAHAAGRPPFKVLGADMLVRLAATRPLAPEDLAGIAGCTPRVRQRYGSGILAAVGRGMAIAEPDLPLFRPSRKSRPLSGVVRRIESLLAWRPLAAERTGLDPGLLLPRRLIEQVAGANPESLEALARVDGIRRWRVDSFGSEILEVITDRERAREREAR
jgi:ribonuclease D